MACSGFGQQRQRSDISNTTFTTRRQQSAIVLLSLQLPSSTFAINPRTQPAPPPTLKTSAPPTLSTLLLPPPRTIHVEVSSVGECTSGRMGSLSEQLREATFLAVTQEDSRQCTYSAIACEGACAQSCVTISVTALR